MRGMNTKLTFLLTLLLTCRAQAQVLPNDAIVEGKTIGEWSAEWWKWAFSLPTNQNPLLDPDGSNATNGQPFQSVFFIAGIYEASGAVTRKFSVPANSYLFLGPRNVEGDN